MKLIITDAIFKNEFEPLDHIFSLEHIKIAARKSIQELGENIKNSIKIPSTRLQKVYLTSPGGAGRAVFLLQVNSEKSVLVMVKTKNDKQVGSNMTIQNLKFKRILEKNLDLILNDLKTKNYREFEL